MQWHASYEALKESLLHELAHWAAYHRYGHWQHLCPSEVATRGHGDCWQREVLRIQVSAPLLLALTLCLLVSLASMHMPLSCEMHRDSSQLLLASDAFG